MHAIGLIEMLLVFGGVLVWAWYEYRTADRLSKQHRRHPKPSDDQQTPAAPGSTPDTQSESRADSRQAKQETCSEQSSQQHPEQYRQQSSEQHPERSSEQHPEQPSEKRV
jgi:Mg-chelatase subunit ChlI